MGSARSWAAALAALSLIAPACAVAQAGDAAPQYVSYTEEVPCPPSASPARVRHRRPRRPVHRRRPVVRQHRLVRRLAKRPPTRARSVAHGRRVRLHHAVVRVSAPVAPKRCSVVRRDRLTAASFGITPETAVLSPIEEDVAPGGPAVASTSSGRAPFGETPDPSTGGGVGANPGGGAGLVSAAPEPDAWALMLLAVATVGWALRRRYREGVVS